MPRHYVRKSERATKYSQDELNNALNAIRADRITVKRASILYNIPRTTLRDHLKGRRGIKSKSFGRSTDISFQEEKKIADGIKAMEKWGFGLSRAEVLEKVGEYVRLNKQKTRFKDGKPGEDWFIGFKSRHRLSIKKPQSVEVARKNSMDPFVIYNYFTLLDTTLNELGIRDKPDHIWNLDETSFSSDPSKTKVVGQIGVPSTRTTSGPGRENTTVLMACNAAGEKAAPLIIFKGKHVYDEWTAPETDTDSCAIVYAATKKGWMEGEVFRNYFTKHLITSFGEKRPILLIYDGHATHIGLELIEEAMRNEITILKLPPHSSHLLQPLDISVFKSLKTSWDGKLVKWQRQNPGKKIIKKSFSLLIKETWDETSPLIIQSGFKKGGIYPFDSTVISEEKFDPAALRRWNQSQNHNVHVTAEIDVAYPMTENQNEDNPLPGGSHENPVVPNRSREIPVVPSGSRDDAMLSGNRDDPVPCGSRDNTVPSGNCDNSVPSRSCDTLVPNPTENLSESRPTFEEILLKTIKSRGDNSVMPKKRIAYGAEVITRQDVINRLKEREQAEKLKKKKGYDNSLKTKKKNNETLLRDI